MALVLADTDVLIDFLRDGGEAERIAFCLKQENLATSCISAFELWSGANSKKLRGATAKLLDAMYIVNCDAKVAERAGELWRLLREQGQTIGMADTLIAATALVLEAPLLTRNQAHFRRIPQLTLA